MARNEKGNYSKFYKLFIEQKLKRSDMRKKMFEKGNMKRSE